MLKTPLRAAICCLLLVVGAGAADAATDPVKVATMLTQAVVAMGDVHLTYDNVSGGGDMVTLTNVTLTVGSTYTATFPSLVISGIADKPGGGFTAQHMAFDGGSAHLPEGETKWAMGSIDDVVVPSPKDIADHAKIRPFAKLNFANLALTQSAKAAPITVASVGIDVGAVSDTAPVAVHMIATGAKMPVGAITNPVGNAMISRMGYTEFNASITMDSTYDTAKNAIAVNALTVDAANVGKLTFSAHMSDTSIGGIADANESSEARAAARLDSVSIRFDDAGFIGRMLDMQADISGSSRDDVRDGLVYGALPFVLNYVQDTTFRQQFQDAAETFLTNPKSFTITATPAMPVPLGEAMRTAVGDPLKLPDLLMPQVAANK